MHRSLSPLSNTRYNRSQQQPSITISLPTSPTSPSTSFAAHSVSSSLSPTSPSSAATHIKRTNAALSPNSVRHARPRSLQDTGKATRNSLSFMSSTQKHRKQHLPPCCRIVVVVVCVCAFSPACLSSPLWSPYRRSKSRFALAGQPDESAALFILQRRNGKAEAGARAIIIPLPQSEPAADVPALQERAVNNSALRAPVAWRICTDVGARTCERVAERRVRVSIFG